MRCPKCKSDMVRRTGRYGDFLRCTGYPACDVTAKLDKHGRMTSTPADGELRAARIAAHQAFDGLWKQAGVRRGRAYQWLAEQLDITARECHIGFFGLAMCHRVVAICELEDVEEFADEMYTREREIVTGDGKTS